MEWKPILFSFLFIAAQSLVSCYENDLWLRRTCKLFCIEKEGVKGLKKNWMSCSSKSCFQCLDSCSLDISQPCSAQCSNTSAPAICIEPCHFLKARYNQEKPGVCSSVRHGFETVDVARCTNDNKCPGPEKCCSNGKLRTCQQPGYVFDSRYPPVPVKVKVKKVSTSIFVSWQLPINSTNAKAVIYLVEKRQSSSFIRPSNGDYSFWKFAGETPAMQITLKDLIPGDWYQIRVTAYALNGTNGFSSHSRSIRMNFEVRRPSPPRNFTALGAWFQNNKIFVKISWTPPLLLDRPVRRYRIIYLKHVDGTDEHYLTVPVKTKKIPGRETSTILTDLEPSSVYVVKIQAMLSVRRGKRVKGRWDVMYLKTPPIARVTTQQEKYPTTTSNIRPTPTYSTKVKLKCMRVFFSNGGLLSAVIRWRVPDIVIGVQFDYFPDKCKKKVKNRDKKTILRNARTNEITLMDLYEDCYYLLKMKTYFANNTEAPFKKSLYFSTYPEVKPAKTPKAIVIKKLNQNASSRLEYSCVVFIVSFFILTLNLGVNIL